MPKAGRLIPARFFSFAWSHSVDVLTIVLFVVGLGLLTIGADVLVKGAATLAGSFGIAPLIIGLTVVAFGTSAPELAVSINSALQGQSDIALGNVV
ncbi:MAG: hypothetical protein C0509_00510, partial [Acinetobacter sp.]|nr:hypothetical protein [Acinetobacter sp.]